MPRAPVERPARRLEAILQALRRNSIKTFKAGKLDGIGEGLEWTFRAERTKPANVTNVTRPTQRVVLPEVEDEADADLQPLPKQPPIDELDLVAQGREGPVS